MLLYLVGPVHQQVYPRAKSAVSIVISFLQTDVHYLIQSRKHHDTR